MCCHDDPRRLGLEMKLRLPLIQLMSCNKLQSVIMKFPPLSHHLCSISLAHRRTAFLPSPPSNPKDVVRRHLTRVIVASSGEPLTLGDMKKFLTTNEVGFEEGFTCLVLDCHFCSLSHHHRGGHGKLFINMTTGSFLCLKCGSCGSWDNLVDWITMLKMGEKRTTLPARDQGFLLYNKEVEETHLVFEQSMPVNHLDGDDFRKLTAAFDLEGVDVSVFDKYEARVTKEKNRLLLPIFSVAEKRIGVHSVSPKSGSDPPVVETIPSNLAGVLFGWKQLNKRQESVILAGSPLQVLAISQQKPQVAVSLPEAKTLPLEVLPLLEPFKKIVLWLGQSLVAWECARIFARKLNERRCYLIRPHDSNPEPSEAIRKQVKISGILRNAHPVSHKAIVTFSSLRKDVLAQFSEAEQVAGTKWKRSPLLSRILKGHRRGELTVFTGPTGSGKTTLMSEYSLDLCIQGVRTLWGSFEVPNSRLVKTMLTQFSQIPLDKQLDQYDVWADRFERLPLYFLTFHGAHSVRSVLDAMRHAVYVHDIEHVVVDNLQFMMGTSETSWAGVDRFWRQDMVVSSFRHFATVHNCHVTLVIHPRKENTDELTNMSIFGGAKATQEADNVLILQDKRLHSLRGRKYIQVTKNRFDGELGIVPLEFDKETLSFFAAKRKPPKKSDKS